jgi:hypothetical protein
VLLCGLTNRNRLILGHVIFSELSPLPEPEVVKQPSLLLLLMMQ